jgi:hypothetical protein
MRIFVFDTQFREVATTFAASGSATDMLMNHTGTRLYVLTADSVVLFDTAANTEVRRQLVRPNGRLNSIALSTDGGSLFVNPELGTSLFRLNSETLSIIEEIPRSTTAPDLSIIFVVP